MTYLIKRQYYHWRHSTALESSGQKLGSFETIFVDTRLVSHFRKNCMAQANRYANILRWFYDFSTQFSSQLQRFHLLLMMILSEICHWHLLAVLDKLVPLINNIFTEGSLTVSLCQHTKTFGALIFIFYTKFVADSLINFFDRKKSPSTWKYIPWYP